MELEKLKVIYGELERLIGEAKAKHNPHPSSRFTVDIIPNLMQSLALQMGYLELGNEPILEEGEVEKETRRIMAYLRIIEQHPEFRERTMRDMKLNGSYELSPSEYVEEAIRVYEGE